MSPTTDEEPAALSSYAAHVLALRLFRLLSHAEGARLGDNVRHIHQMRVWSRRYRAAHDLFSVCFPGKEYQVLGREIKAVTDALGEARDLDVMIETVQSRSQKLADAERGGVTTYLERLKAKRKNRQRDVERALCRLERRQVRERFAALLVKQGVELPNSALNLRDRRTPSRPDAAQQVSAEDRTVNG